MRYRDLWAFGTAPAPYGLGMQSAEFWGLYPPCFYALKRRYEQHQEREEHLLAVIRMDLHNIWCRSKDSHPEPYPHSQFLLRKSKSTPSDSDVDDYGQTPQQKIALMREILAPMGYDTIRFREYSGLD